MVGHESGHAVLSSSACSQQTRMGSMGCPCPASVSAAGCVTFSASLAAVHLIKCSHSFSELLMCASSAPREGAAGSLVAFCYGEKGK